MKKLLLLLLLLPFTLVAQIPVGYYDGTEGKKGAELKTILHNKIKGHTVRTYNQLWTDYQRTDMRPDGTTIWCIWTECPFKFGPASQGGNQQGTGGAQGECHVYNREHVFCSSWMNPVRTGTGGADRMTSYTDLFHIYPVDATTNTVRNDNPYGMVTNPRSTTAIGSKTGPNTFPGGYTGTAFEPVDEYKGDVARSIFYMVTRYENEICTWFFRVKSRGGLETMHNTTFPGLRPWMLDMLYQWHQLDPVSDKERRRNDSVYAIQGNRNPFIDHPEFADSIFGYWLRYPDQSVLCLDIPDGPETHPFPEGFETLDGTDAGNYNGYYMQFGTGEWYIKGMTSMDANDRRNGNRSVRLRGNATDEDHRVEMNFDNENGIGTVSFAYGSYSSHSGGRIQLQVSTDEGTTWNNYGNVIVVPSWVSSGSAFRTASIVVNEMRPARIRIVKESQTGSTSVNIDDIDLTDCVPELDVSMEDLEFGNVAIGRTDVAIIEVSGINLIDNISYTLSGDNVFTVTPLSWNAAIGGTLRVGFTPTAEQTYTAEILFESEDAEPEAINLIGTGTQAFPEITIRPSTMINFDEVALGTTSTIHPIEILGFDLIGDISYTFVDTTVLLSETFGAGVSGSNVAIANYMGWTRTGTSANSITYSGTTDIRTTSASSGYPSASGGGNVFFAAAGGAEFNVHNINPGHATNFLLSFGLQSSAANLVVSYSTNGTTWTPISYTKITTTWGLVSTQFSIPETTTTLYLKFVGGAITGGFRMDDLLVRSISEQKNTDFFAFESPWNPANGGTLFTLFSPKREGEQNAVITVKSTGTADRKITLRATGITPRNCNDTLATLNQKIAGLNDTILDLRFTILDLNDTIESLLLQILALQNEECPDTLHLYNQVLNLLVNIANLNDTIYDLRSDISNLLDTIESRNDTIANLKYKIVNLINDTANLNLTIANLLDEIDGHLERISGLHNDTANLNLTIAGLQNDISNLLDTIKSRNDTIVNLKSKIVNLIGDTARLYALVVVLELENEILHDSIIKLLQMLEDCNPTGIRDLGVFNTPLQAFPNPVVNELRITNYEYKYGDIVELYDMNGRKIYSRPAPHTSYPETFSIDMSSFQQGTYILRIGNQVAKIMKQ
jgi:endonuclease I/predicted  nucleic acid-binding Zn-ribbon protein